MTSRCLSCAHQNLDLNDNPVAMIAVGVLFGIYILLFVVCRHFDQRDLRKVMMVPLCGRNGSFKHEVIVKTSSSIGSGESRDHSCRLFVMKQAIFATRTGFINSKKILSIEIQCF